MKAILSGMVIGMGTMALVTGCSTTGRKVDQAAVNQISVGDSKESVQALIGAPEQIVASTSGGETWRYEYRRSSPNAKRFIPLAGTFIGGKNVETQTITIAFDQDGRVADVQSAYGGTDSKGRPVVGSTDGSSATTAPSATR